MSKHYIIKEKIEMPTLSLTDIFVRALAESMRTTEQETEILFNIKR